MKITITSIQRFAQTIHKILQSDRDVVMGIGGFTGEGKSCFASQMQMAYAEIAGTEWSFAENMTWERKELLRWIDGEYETRKGQKKEYSGLLADELISMFYRRNWYEDPQKEAVELFNKCRDRHLFIAGNVPDFWDLDTGFIKRIRFYVYITERGRAWVFEQENNPFSVDPWNVNENRKNFRKHKAPYRLPNFVTEIRFDDWTPEQKKQYYEIRNKKRLGTEGQNKGNKAERLGGGLKQYKQLEQRDKLIRLILNKELLSVAELAELIEVHPDTVRRIHRGDRGKKSE